MDQPAKRAKQSHAIDSEDAPEKDQSERDLESFLFGDHIAEHKQSALERVGREFDQNNLDDTLHAVADEQLFFFDTKPLASEDPTLSVPTSGSSKAAWHDDDDAETMVDIARLKKLHKHEGEEVVDGKDYESRLRQYHERVFPKPSWAETPREKQQSSTKSKKSKRAKGSDEDDEDEEAEVAIEELLTSAKPLSERAPRHQLPPSILEVNRLRDANYKEVSESVVRSINWHPNGQVLLTAGLDKTLRLFAIDGVENEKIQSVHFEKFPIRKAQFTSNGEEIIVAGRRKNFFSYNVESGKITNVPGIRGRDEKSWESFVVSPDNRYISFLGRNGSIVLVSQKTKQWTADLKMNGTVEAVDFSPDGHTLLSTGRDGDVYQWDLRTNRCVFKFQDHGSFNNTCLSVCNKYIATGSKTGIVNIYDVSTALSSSNPIPLRAIDNLTTSIGYLKWSPDGQMLGLSSHAKRDQFKIVHMPTCTVFQNFPDDRTPLKYVECFEWNARSNMLAIGNDKGKVLLYQLPHFQ